jgi:ribosomal protein S18 acetylase RimI-like enzyme
MKQYELLKWDSDFFGFPVARINDISSDDLENVLDSLRKKDVKLVYLAVNENDKKLSNLAKSLNGLYVGQKVRYVCNLKNHAFNFPASYVFERYIEVKPNKDLIRLILQACVHSRFYYDMNITTQQCEDLFKLWIADSVKHNIIFVIKRRDLFYKDRIIGFVSLNRKGGRGNFDFIAVDEDYRGNGFGKILMRFAHNWFLSNDYHVVQADTQMDNFSACRLYQRHGYQVEKVEDFYHFWLR